MLRSVEQDWLLSQCGGSVREFYTMIGVTLPNRQTSNVDVRCFASPESHSREDRNPSCSISLITGLWHCKGCGRSGNPYSAAITQGYAEQRARELARSHGLFLEVAKPDKPKMPTERTLKTWRRALLEDPQLMARCWEAKGWLPRALVRCGVGWDGERLTFPVRNPKLKVIGVARYLPGGKPKTLALAGSKRDLFPAPEVCSKRRPLFLVEGEPDAISVWSTGHQAVAIPGVGNWRPEWAQRLRGRRVVLLADCDPQGRELADRVSQVVPDATVVDLGPARSDGYDIGDWIREAIADGGIDQASRVLGRLVA